MQTPDSPFIKDYFRHWIRAIRVKPSTRAGYAVRGRHIIERNSILSSLTLEQLDRTLVKAWHSTLVPSGISERTAHDCYATLRAMLSFAMEEGIIDKNPAAGLRISKGERSKIDKRTKEQLIALADAGPPWYRALILCLGVIGIRVGEAAGLRIRNVDLDNRCIRIEETLVTVGGKKFGGTTKTGQSRTIRIPVFLADALRQHIWTHRAAAGSSDRMFVNRMGMELDASQVRRALKGSARRCGQPALSTHSLRNTAADLALEAGAELRDIQNMLGHSNLMTTFLYLQRIRQDPMASRLADKLDIFFLGR